MNNLTDIKSMTLDELTDYVTENGFPKFRAKQIYDWLYKNVTDFDDMRNIPADLKAFLKSSCYISVANIEKKLVSRYDKTVKYLFSFNDGECVESVVMSYKHGYSICISTQVGCKMGCTFCATGKSGFSRSLAPSEMLGQIEAAQRDLNIRISNIVLPLLCLEFQCRCVFIVLEERLHREDDDEKTGDGVADELRHARNLLHIKRTGREHSNEERRDRQQLRIALDHHGREKSLAAEADDEALLEVAVVAYDFDRTCEAADRAGDGHSDHTDPGGIHTGKFCKVRVFADGFQLLAERRVVKGPDGKNPDDQHEVKRDGQLARLHDLRKRRRNVIGLRVCNRRLQRAEHKE